MNEEVVIGILLPAILMAVLGWVVPQQLAKIMPEGVGPLFLIAALSFVILLVLAVVVFLVLYHLQGNSLDGVSGAVIVFIFGSSAVRSALIWLPIMIISVANLPRKWTKEVW